MRILLLAGASLLALASPAMAQQTDHTEPADPSQLDTLVPATNSRPRRAAEADRRCGVDRLNALEARVSQLEAANAQLKQQAELNEGRIETVETRAAKTVQFGWAPTFSDPTGNFTFKPRGVIEADSAAFNERAGGYDFNNGTASAAPASASKAPRSNGSTIAPRSISPAMR